MPRAANSIAAALARLESALAARHAPARIARLGDASFLDFLFQIEVRRLVRLGPEACARSGLSPGDLLTSARRAAVAGVLPVSTPVELARWLRELARSIQDAGAWRADSPLWWEPLAAASEPEAIYETLDLRLAEPGGLPSAEALAGSFGEGAIRRWLFLPGLLPEEFCATLHRELESAFIAGDLPLELGAVGAAGRLSASRTDAVLYLSGLESDLLDRLPRLAVLAQWCLAGLIPRLAQRLRGDELHAPITAMLARYPGPSGGYRAHFDNPGAAADNGRELAVVLYLNPPGQTCVGGDLELWSTTAASSDPPTERLTPAAGSVALMDCRATLHQVEPLAEGPARWSLALWLNRAPQREFTPPPVPALTLTEALLAIESPPVRRGRVLMHELGSDPAGELTVRTAGTARPRTGIVATVYGGGAGLERWCRLEEGLAVDGAAGPGDRRRGSRRPAGRVPLPA